MTVERRPAAVLFDLDGTLVDSEKLWYRALSELAAAIGGRLSTAARTAMIGAAMTRAVRILHRDLGVRDRDGAADIAWLEDRVAALMAVDGLTWQPGAPELVAAVRAAGIPTALVTSSARRLAEAALTTLGRHNFDVIVTRDDVTNPKPDPEPYAHAAELLGVAVTACVAIEDSAAGVASARRAGAVVLAVSSGQALPRAAGIHHRPALGGVDVSILAAVTTLIAEPE